MTFTYDSTVISTDLGKVRTLIGDTNSADPLLTDEQINYFLTETPSVYLAAANAVELGVLPSIARRIDRSGTGFSASRSQMTQHYQDVAKALRAKAAGLVSATWTGVDQTSIDAIEEDDDFIKPTFREGQDDNRG